MNGAVHLAWRLVSEYRNRTVGASHSTPVITHVIWKRPEEISKETFRWGSGGKKRSPAPPFYFLKENQQGSSPNVTVRDRKERVWRVKWGEEVRSETFASRLAWNAGYFVEPSYFIPQGNITRAHNLTRAKAHIDPNGNFRDARFELDLEDVEKKFDEKSWSWNANPFVGTHELHGLKVMMMLTSNWDNKDVRDSARGSNTAVFVHKKRKKTFEARYLVVDWGGSMGKWGSNILFRTKWDAPGFAEQTPAFVQGVNNGYVVWGYTGQRTADAVETISIEDVRWLCRWLNDIKDEHLLEGLIASGASDADIQIFLKALRERIQQLQKLAGQKQARISHRVPGVQVPLAQ